MALGRVAKRGDPRALELLVQSLEKAATSEAASKGKGKGKTSTKGEVHKKWQKWFRQEAAQTLLSVGEPHDDRAIELLDTHLLQDEDAETREAGCRGRQEPGFSGRTYRCLGRVPERELR